MRRYQNASAQFMQPCRKDTIDLTQGLGRPVERRLYGVSSPPIICCDVVVMGSKVHEVPLQKEMPPGDVRGFDVRTGKQMWQFHSIPREGEFNNETWEQGSWKTTGAANVWTMMSADEALGYVYLPFGTSANDHYGVHRPGDGLFGDSLVALDARTGQRVWHFQMAHHGLWDYDLPSAPNLIDVRVNGQPVGQTDLAHRRASRPAGHSAWREIVPEAALPDQARAVRPAGRHKGRRDRLHAGAAQTGAGHSGEIQLRPTFHAAFSGEADDCDARHRRRRELVGRGVRP